jgi:hypothetical protein
VLGDYLEEAGVARHATDMVARDLLEVAQQAAVSKPRLPAGIAQHTD